MCFLAPGGKNFDSQNTKENTKEHTKANFCGAENLLGGKIFIAKIQRKTQREHKEKCFRWGNIFGRKIYSQNTKENTKEHTKTIFLVRKNFGRTKSL